MGQEKLLQQRVNGRLFLKEGRGALLLDEAGSPVFLRFALVLRGSERHILPASLLDDWGHEFRDLSLYRWLRHEGDLFPRAELFGYGLDDAAEQCFVRDLELHWPFPCYVYEKAGAPPSAGIPLDTIFLPSPFAGTGAGPVAPPPGVEGPLRQAAITWLAVGPEGPAGSG